ncbi:MAG: D-alanyl-D-alanine carboxypeptidase [Clostridia bacterium]|nr:D-alanyl-D-alanine carboxypeptidase [Clostridia bacterium]
MLKKSIAFLLSLLIFIIPLSVTAAAYEPNGFPISAKSVVFACLDTGEVLYSREADKKVYPASITKIMTVTLMLESKKYNPDKKIAMTEEALKLISGTGSTVSNLRIGEKITELDLAYFILMSSSGDCAYLAAIHYGGSVEGFVEMMNKKAQSLGLKNTHYENPVGLHNEQNYTTANDTIKLTKYALKNETFKKICESARYTIPATNFSKERTISTTNFLQDNTTNYFYAYAKGIKTGYTDEAGRCLVSSASYNGYNYICAMFGCPVDPYKRHEFVDSKNLYRWAFNTFEYKQVADLQNPICEVGVELSLDTDYIPLYIEKEFVTVLPKNADDSTISVEPHLKSKTVEAPVKKGDILGTADIIYAEEKIGTVNLVANENVERSTILYVFKGLKTFFLSKYMMAVYILIGAVIFAFFVGVYHLNKKRKKKRKVRYIPYNKHNRDDR